MSKKLINLSNLQKFLLKLNERFALKKAMKGITEDSEGNIIIGEEGLVPTPDENSKGKFLRSDGTWSVPGDSPLYEPMTQEEGIEGVSEVNKVLSAKTLKAVVEDEISTNENVVHTSGNEEVGGVKTFRENMYIKRDGPRMRLQDTRCTKGTTPESSFYNQALYIYDTNHVAYGGLEHSYLNDASNQISMISFSGTTNDNVDYAKITVGYDKDGKWYTYAPTPADTDKSTKIATTEFVSKKDENVVHKSGNETIAGNKTFTNQIYLGAGGTSYGQISAKDNNSILRLFGGTSAGTGANLDLYGENISDGGFSLRARTSDKIVGLDGKVDGTLKWNGKNVALDENLVHKTGNETIAGNKTFSNRVSFPSGYYLTTDANDNSLRIIRDGSNHGNNYKVIIQGDTGKFFAPNGFMGNLQGNADTSTKSSYLDNYSSPNANKIYLDWDQQVKGYVGLKVDNIVLGGLMTTGNLSSQKDTLCSTFANAIKFGGVGCIKLLAFEWEGGNTSAFSLQEGTSFPGAKLRHIVESLSGLFTIPSGSDTIKKYSSGFYLGTRPTGTWSLLSSFNAFDRSYHPEVCIGLFVRIA